MIEMEGREVDNSALLAAVAAGDVEAQRCIVQLALNDVKTGQCNTLLGFNGLLILARIAAARGAIQDRVVLAGCLCAASSFMADEGYSAASDALAAEALVILEGVADEGSEISADCLNHLIENLPPHVAAAAKMMKESA